MKPSDHIDAWHDEDEDGDPIMVVSLSQPGLLILIAAAVLLIFAVGYACGDAGAFG